MLFSNILEQRIIWNKLSFWKLHQWSMKSIFYSGWCCSRFFVPFLLSPFYSNQILILFNIYLLLHVIFYDYGENPHQSIHSLHLYFVFVLAVKNTVQPEKYVDPAMIGILVAMFLMFITICVVLRLFSRYVCIKI